MTATALIVDDDASFANAFVEFASKQGYEANSAGSLEAARASCRAVAPALVILDLQLPDGDGLDLIADLDQDRTRVVVVTGYPDVENAVRSLRIRVDDYLSKPLKPADLTRILKESCPSSSSPPQRGSASTPRAHARGFGPLVGLSRPMRAMYSNLEKVARTDANVLITGETGTGKELVAEAIHACSERRKGKLVAVNCGALAPELIATELFGHERGSFTGASRRHRGVFERGQGGTIFLDEITEMPLALQVHLLRVLETKTFVPVGGESEHAFDVRIVAACNRDPLEAVANGRLREDLFYRLNVFPLRVPPLRERTGDVALLVQHFLDESEKTSSPRSVVVSDDAMLSLEAYRWPGNVRELRNAVERAQVVSGELLGVDDFANMARDGCEPVDGELACRVGMRIAQVERSLILATLEHYDGNKPLAAKALGISLKTLYNRLHAYSPEH